MVDLLSLNLEIYVMNHCRVKTTEGSEFVELKIFIETSDVHKLTKAHSGHNTRIRSDCNLAQWQILKQRLWKQGWSIQASQYLMSGNTMSSICTSGHPSVFIPLSYFRLAWISAHEGRMPYSPPSLNILKSLMWFQMWEKRSRDQEPTHIQEIKLLVMSVSWICRRAKERLFSWFGDKVAGISACRTRRFGPNDA